MHCPSALTSVVSSRAISSKSDALFILTYKMKRNLEKQFKTVKKSLKC